MIDTQYLICVQRKCSWAILLYFWFLLLSNFGFVKRLGYLGEGGEHKEVFPPLSSLSTLLVGKIK